MTVHFANGKAKLLSSGSQLPGPAVSNAELFAHIEQHCGKKLAKKAARISRNFGINQRHLCRSNLTGFTPPDHSAPQLCVDAIQNALLEAGRNLVIDYLIGHTTTSETLVPPNIAWVADKLNHIAPCHNAVAVKNNGASLFLKGIEAITQRGYSLDDFAYILPHQVNGYLDELFEQHLGIANEKVIVDAGSLGNLGSAAIWVSFDRLRKSGRLNKGDKVLVLGAEATKYLYGGFVFHV
jgi:3-oxoacyl-[acyl-carrier-protein] synthase III